MFYKTLLLFQTVEGLEPEIESQNLFNVISESNLLAWVIYIILFFLAILAVYIFVSRYSAIKKAGRIDQNFMNNIRANVQANNIPGAKALCQTTDSPVARMVEKGLQRIGKPLRDIDAAIENVGNLEIFKMEKNLSTLASIAGAAPMIGFFGTVTGMIDSFYQMSTQQNVTPTVLAGGIYTALITTAMGLAIGITAFVGYNILVANVEKVVYRMERTTTEFMDLLQEPSA
jgi:biopolymer transport protein ExbB